MSTDPEQRVPTDEQTDEQDLTSMCEKISDLCLEYDISIATAESLTAGNLAAMFGKAPSSGEWFRGGIVAYDKRVKHSLLKVPEGPVVTEKAAATMARTTSELLGADLTIAVTGEAGPETQENDPPGTVWVGVCDRGTVTTSRERFEGEPPEILAATLAHSVKSLLDHVSERSNR